MNIYIDSITKSFQNKKILDSLSFNIKSEKITAILGPSGCGKTTLLKILSQIIEPDSGNIKWEKQNPIKSFIFQEPRLLPTLTSLENIECVLENDFNKKEARERALYYIELVGLQNEIHLKNHELSGGMRQRISIARAFAKKSDIIFMDEPFQSLDLKNRIELVNIFLSLWQKEKRSAVFVTHDIEEAVYLGDEIILLTDKPAHIKATIQNTDKNTHGFNGKLLSSKISQKIYSLVLS